MVATVTGAKSGYPIKDGSGNTIIGKHNPGAGGDVDGFEDIVVGVLADDEVSPWVELPAHSDKTLHAYGDFYSTSIAVYGSNDPRCIDDPDNADEEQLKLSDESTALALTSSAKIRVLHANPRFIRFKPTGGDSGGTTAVSVAISANRS